jgi:hypothetical protein
MGKLLMTAFLVFDSHMIAIHAYGDSGVVSYVQIAIFVGIGACLRVNLRMVSDAMR